MYRIFVLISLYLLSSCKDKNVNREHEAVIVAYEISKPSRVFVYSIKDKHIHVIEYSDSRKDIFLNINDTIRIEYKNGSMEIVDKQFFNKKPKDSIDKIVCIKNFYSIR